MKHKKNSGHDEQGVGKSAPDETLRPSRREETRLEIPAGEPDLEALRSVTREWLVPLLVEKFLREQGVELRARPNASPRNAPNSKTESSNRSRMDRRGDRV